MMTSDKKVAPLYALESNPDVMNKFLHLMGVPEKWNLVDVFGLDAECLNWVPRPVLGVMLLFPCSDEFYRHAEIEEEKVRNKGQVLVPDLFYMKQYLTNACGTIALVHIVANKAEKIGLEDGAFKKLLDVASSLTPEERGQMLIKQHENEALSLLIAHQELAMEGQTQAKTKANHHFVAFVERGGYLYELDGRKLFPINHGTTTEDTFLEDAAKICQGFIDRDADDVNFTVMALTASDN